MDAWIIFLKVSEAFFLFFSILGWLADEIDDGFLM